MDKTDLHCDSKTEPVLCSTGTETKLNEKKEKAMLFLTTIIATGRRGCKRSLEMKGRNFSSAAAQWHRSWLRQCQEVNSISLLQLRHTSTLSITWRPKHTILLKKNGHIPKDQITFPRNQSSTTMTTRAKTISPIRKVMFSSSAENNDGNISLEDEEQIVTKKIREEGMDQLVRELIDECCRPDVSEGAESLTRTLKALQKLPQQAEAILREYEDEQQRRQQKSSQQNDNNDDDLLYRCKSNHIHYQLVINAWLQFNPPSPKRAESLLNEYIKNNKQKEIEDKNISDQIRCNIVDLFNTVLEGWSLSGQGEAAQRVLDGMNKIHSVKPTFTSYRHVINAWSKSKSPKSVLHIDTLLDEMKQQQQEQGQRIPIECYIIAMECWVKSGRKNSIQRLENLYSNIITSLDEEDGIDDDGGEKNDEAKLRVQQLQHAALLVLQGYNKISNAHGAEEFLFQFVEQYSSSHMEDDVDDDVDDSDGNRTHSIITSGGIKPTIAMCLSVLMTWSKSKSSNRGPRCEKLLSIMNKNESLPNPNMSCYNAVLHCLSTSNKENAPHRAELVLRLMEGAIDNNNNNDDDEFPDDGDVDDDDDETYIQPNRLSYTCVMNAWARSKNENAPDHVERLVQEMKERNIDIDRRIYNILIVTWGRSSQRPESIQKVEEYFHTLQRIYRTTKDESIKPTVVEYTAVIQAWCNYVSSHVEQSREATSRVESLLDEMIQSENDNNDEDGSNDDENANINTTRNKDPSSSSSFNILKPNLMTFSAVLGTIAASRRIPYRRQKHANKVLQIMKRQGTEITPHIEALVRKCGP